MAALVDSQLHTLHRSTGSAHHVSTNLAQEVLCSVNGPVDVQRRDELPNEAFIDVHVRPNHGVGMIRERHLEGLVHGLLKNVILARLWPRTAIQITLQVIKDGLREKRKGHRSDYLTILPALLNATCLALIDAGVPMRCTFASTLLQLDDTTNHFIQPGNASFERAQSTHVFAFSSKGELLLAESEGSFTITQWEGVEAVAKEICMGVEAGDKMAVDGKELEELGLIDGVRDVVGSRLEADNRWRDG